MDDLEFRRRVFANPNTTDQDVNNAAKADEEKARLKASLQSLDSKLSQAVKVPVPDDLAYKLIWQQATEDFNRHKRRSNWMVAMAASVAFMVGITATMLYQAQPHNLSNDALAHVRYAELELPHSNVDVDMQQVNAKLAGFGGHFTQSLGNVTVANYCTLNTTQSLHLILDTEQGQMSVFIVPHRDNLDMPANFADDKFHGESWALQKANIMVVGDKNANLEPMMEKVKQSINFSA